MRASPLIVAIVFALTMLATPRAAARPADAEALFAGVWYWKAKPVADWPQVIHVLEVDLSRPGVSLMATPGAPEAGREFVAMTPSVFLARHGLQAAINGGYFLPFKGGSAAGYDYYPYAGDPVFVSGASMHDGRLTSPVETDPADLENYDVRITTIFCVLRNRVIILGGQTCPRGAREAIAAGPRLLEGGMRASLPTRSTEPAAQSVPAGATPAQVARPRGGGPRTAVGVDKSGKRLFLVVVDGRQEGYSMGATSEQLQMLFESFGAHDAMSFDGGGSSTMVAAGHAGAPRLLSRPIHTGVPGRERPSANHLGVRANALAGKSK